MEFSEVVSKRYSHKVAFDPQIKVPQEHLRRIVETAMAGPSAGNNQSPEFIIIDDEATARRIGQLTTNVPLQTAPALICVITRPRSREVLDISTECLIADWAIAVYSLQMAATALGYSCGFVDGPFNANNKETRDKAQKILGIPDDRMLVAIVPVGNPGEPGPRRPKKPFEERASWNRYEVVREG